MAPGGSLLTVTGPGSSDLPCSCMAEESHSTASRLLGHFFFQTIKEL